MSPRHSSRSRCLNCGSSLDGPYCSKCGQHDVDYSGSFWHIIEDALEGALHFDGKFFRSARYIFTRPGFLTTEFVAGRRVRYMHPVRLYIFASFLFFAANVLTSHSTKPDSAAIASPSIMAKTSAPNGDSPGPKDAKSTGGMPKVNFNLSLPPDHATRSWLDDPLLITVDPKDKVSQRDLAKEIWHLLPEMLILCLPLLALVLKLVYFKSGRPYLEHIIFAIHIQALAFLSFILIKAGGSLASVVSKDFESMVGVILLLGMFLLIYRAFRVVYRQGRVKTAFKFALVLVGYGLILLFAFVALGTSSTYLVSRGS
jgi:hypothetical protein